MSDLRHLRDSNPLSTVESFRAFDERERVLGWIGTDPKAPSTRSWQDFSLLYPLSYGGEPPAGFEPATDEIM